MLHHQVGAGIIACTVVRRIDEISCEVHTIADVIRAATPCPVLYAAILTVFTPFTLGASTLYHLSATAGSGDVEGYTGRGHSLKKCHLGVS